MNKAFIPYYLEMLDKAAQKWLKDKGLDSTDDFSKAFVSGINEAENYILKRLQQIDESEDLVDLLVDYSKSIALSDANTDKQMVENVGKIQVCEFLIEIINLGMIE